MLIPGYLDTLVPCGLPRSRETSNLPSYCDRFHQSTDCPCDHMQASTALAAAENAERPVLVDNYRTRSTLSAAPHPPSLQSSLVLAGADTVHAFIYVRRVGFVKCHEWRVACNRLTVTCPRKIAAAIAFEVALQVASVARSVFMTSQLYRRLSALSVLSRYCWVVNACRLPPVIRYQHHH